MASATHIETVPVSQPTEVMLRKSMPSVLGLAAFASTTFLLAIINLVWGVTAAALILPIALFYGGLAQLIAGLYAFQQNNPIGWGAHGTWGAFWLTLGTWFWVTDVTHAIAAPVGTLHGVLGVMLIFFAVPTFYLAVAAHFESGAVELVLHLLWIGTTIVGIGLLGSSTVVSDIGYLVLIASSIAAWYASAALVVNGVTHFGEVPTAAREVTVRTSTTETGSTAHA